MSKKLEEKILKAGPVGTAVTYRHVLGGIVVVATFNDREFDLESHKLVLDHRGVRLPDTEIMKDLQAATIEVISVLNQQTRQLGIIPK